MSGPTAPYRIWGADHDAEALAQMANACRLPVEAAGASPSGEVDLEAKIKDVRPLDAAGRGDLSFLDNPKYLPLFAQTGASACLVAPKFAGQAPGGTASARK